MHVYSQLLLILLLTLAAPVSFADQSPELKGVTCESLLADDLINPGDFAGVIGTDESSYFRQVPEALEILLTAGRLLRNRLMWFNKPGAHLVRVEQLVVSLSAQARRMEALTIRYERSRGLFAQTNNADTVRFLRDSHKAILSWANGIDRILKGRDPSTPVMPKFLDGVDIFRLVYRAKAFELLVAGHLPNVRPDLREKINGSSQIDIIFAGGRAWAEVNPVHFGKEPEVGWADSAVVNQAHSYRREVGLQDGDLPRLYFISLFELPPRLRLELEKVYDHVIEAGPFKIPTQPNGSK